MTARVTGKVNSTTAKLPVRVSNSDWLGLNPEWTTTGATTINNHEGLSRDERETTRELIKILLKGGE
jgi:hypothetical protein